MVDLASARTHIQLPWAQRDDTSTDTFSPGTATPPLNEGGAEQSDACRHKHSDPRPLVGYAVLLASYAGIAAGLTAALRGRRNQVNPLGLRDLVLFGLATQHISRIISKDSVTSVLRVPFVTFEGPAGDGEVNEKVEGQGLRHAAGELITCPFCLAQWVATALLAGRALAPTVTSGVVAVSAVARASDYLQLAYGWMKGVQ
jgi:hypothetical protein